MAKKEGATQTGVLDDNPAVRRVGSDRMAAMDALSSRRREDVSAETGVDIPAQAASGGADPDADRDAEGYIDPNETAESKAAKVKAAADAEAKEKEEAARVAAANPDDQLARQMAEDGRVVIEGDLSKYFIKGRVDGQDVEIPLDRAARVMQKDYAADQRLENATRLQKEAEAALNKARTAGDAEEIQRAKEKAAKATQDLEDTRTKLKTAGDALFAGDPDAFADALLNVVGNGRASESSATQPDPSKIADAVIAKVEQKTALKQFATDYPEIVANKHLAAMADEEIGRLMEEGTSFADALKEAGESVLDSVKGLARKRGMSEAPASTGTRVDRQSRKAEIDEPATARSAQASSKQGEQPQTASGVIEEMRQARLAGVRARPPT